MSGPPYPPGAFVPFNYWTTIISQYANSNILTTLIGDFFQWLDQTTDFNNFYNDMWNVATAQGYGLDVWGRIVGVTRVVNIANAGKYFGFDEATTLSADPFNQSPFFIGSPLTTNFSLTDSAFRTLIYAKALANICDGSIPAMNALLRNLFPGRGNCYVIDNNNMTMIWAFHFTLSAVELAILGQSGVLPKPVGVAAVVAQV